MLEHLIDADPRAFLPVENASPAELLDAQYTTAKLLGTLDLPPDSASIQAAQASLARQAFTSLTQTQDITTQKALLTQIEVPEAVKELVGMLTAYDWAFVEQAKELRGYTVAKITEETTHPDARIRLKALELLGKVTEVALFSERVEVKKVGVSDSELDAELIKRLEQYKALEKEVVEGEIVGASTETQEKAP